MLVLQRKEDEKIRLGKNVTITVVEIRDNKVRLGITAPNEMPVHREEVFELIESNGEVIADVFEEVAALKAQVAMQSKIIDRLKKECGTTSLEEPTS